MAVTTEVRAPHAPTELPRVTDPSKVPPNDARGLSKLFFDRLATLEEGTPEYQYARNTLIEMNMTLVRYAAGRFRSRGPQELEDIVQVGMIGLIKAIDRFDISREVEFTSFAVPYIVGEIKRFFRDTSWAVHVPRRLQEARVELAKATEELSSRLGRTPTTRELSELMNLPEQEVRDAKVASNGYRSASSTRPSAAARTARASSPTSSVPRTPDWSWWRTSTASPRCSPSSTRATGRSSTCASWKSSPRHRSGSGSASPRCTSPACSTVS